MDVHVGVKETICNMGINYAMRTSESIVHLEKASFLFHRLGKST